MQYFIDPTNTLLASHVDSQGFRGKEKWLNDFLAQKHSISTTKEYQKLLNDLIKITDSLRFSFFATSFQQSLMEIKNKKPLTEKTQWGGVILRFVDVKNDKIIKDLVIKKGGLLGFEIHKEKLENLEVLEGYCLVLYSNHKKKGFKNGAISVKIATKGDTFQFQPYDEHGIIALTNCVIEETSTNHLDDLVYIYKAS